MAVWERQTQKQRRKAPSFSSSLLDAIYHSIDEQQKQEVEDFVLHRRNNAAHVEQEVESLRRAIMVEKWMENYSTTPTTPRHLSSNSGSSTDSSIFSSSETESSVSRSTPRSSSKQSQTSKIARAKSRAMKIYGDLKKAREPISPGGKISNFLNSIFSPRNMKKNQALDEWRKSKSMKETSTTCSLASRSCLSKNPSARGNKSKRSVRFCPVSVILDEDNQPCGHKSTYREGGDCNNYSVSVPSIGSQFIKKNIDSFRAYEGKSVRKHEFREFYDNESEVDDKSCASSDLFELENIGRVGIGAYEEELPVYGTTSLKINQAIASGLLM